MHVALAVFLLFGDFSHTPKPTPAPAQEISPIQAVAIDKNKLEAKVNEIRKEKAAAKAAEQKRLRDLEQQAADAKKKRAQEQAKIKQLEQQRKRKEAEKKKADLAAKKAKAKAAEAEKLRKKKEVEQKKAEKAAADAKAKRIKQEQAAKKAEELRKQKEAERKRKEREAKERAMAEQMLVEQMEAEAAQRQKARSQYVQTEKQKYAQLYRNLIASNLIGDEQLLRDKSCTITIHLSLSGRIKYVDVNAGEKQICDATKRAALRVNQFPMSDDEDLNRELMDIRLTYSPSN